MSTTRLPELPFLQPTLGYAVQDKATRDMIRDYARAYGLAVWKAAMQEAARELEKIACIVSGPHESDGQYALLNACASALRSLPLPEQGGPQ